jgi:CCR4-NOT transcriptional complex subunit CAF120
MDPRDDRTSIVRAEFKTCLNNQLKSKSKKSVAQAPNPPVMPSVASVLNDNSNGAQMPGPSQDTGSLPSLPQLPPLTFNTPIPNSVQPRQRLSSITERSNFTIDDRALSFVSPSTTNSSGTEKSGQHQRQTTLDTKAQLAIPSVTNDSPSPTYSSQPPTPIGRTTPSTLTVDANIKTEAPSLTLNTSSAVDPAVDPLTNPPPHHSPTRPQSILTNPHHSPTQSVFTNPHQGSEHSDSPTAINLNHSSPPLHDLNTPAASSPIPHSAGSGRAKSLRSPLRTSFDNGPTPVNSPQPFPDVLLELEKVRAVVANPPTIEGSVKDTPNEAEIPQSLPARSGDPVTALKTCGDVAIDTSAQRNTSTMSWKSPVIPSAGSRIVGRLSPTRSGLGRKPSGARAQVTPRSYNRVGPESFSSQTLTEEEESMSEKRDQESLNKNPYDDDNAEALAALTYLDMADLQDVSTSPTPPTPQLRSPIITPPSVERPRFQLSDGPSIPSTMSSSDSVPYRSSFAPSSKVAERIMKVQAQQAAHEAAKHRPGRANGKKKAKTTAAGAWGESSDEEDDEEEDDDEDEVDSDPEVPMRGPQSSSSQQGFSSSSSSRPPLSSQYGTSDSNVGGPPSHLRPPRHLPPVPPGRPGKCYDSVHCVDVL